MLRLHKRAMSLRPDYEDRLNDAISYELAPGGRICCQRHKLALSQVLPDRRWE